MGPKTKFFIAAIGSGFMAGFCIMTDEKVLHILAMISAANAGHALSGLAWEPWKR